MYVPSEQFSLEAQAIAWLDRVCQRATEGRRAARALSAHVRPFGLSEAEFRLLWLLANHADGCMLSQTQLVAALALSPAQVSSLVERLGQPEWIASEADPQDRRCQRWCLRAPGEALVRQIVARVDLAKEAPGILARRDAA